MRPDLSRRGVLGGLATLTALPAPLADRSEPDPVFAAIAAARELDDALLVLLKDLDEDDAAAMHAANEASDRSSEAMMALDAVIPTTTAGLHALIRHYAEDCARQDTYSVGAVCLQHLARCIALPTLG